MDEREVEEEERSQEKKAAEILVDREQEVSSKIDSEKLKSGWSTAADISCAIPWSLYDILETLR